MMLVLLQFEVGDTVPADVPLKVTVLEPCVPPKLVPVMVTGVPVGPEFGTRFVMLGLVPFVLAAPTP